MAGPMVFKDKETEKAAEEFLATHPMQHPQPVSISFSVDVVEAAYKRIRADTRERKSTSAFNPEAPDYNSAFPALTQNSKTRLK